MARITGYGGFFFRSPDPKALADWYRDTLGLDVQDWGGALLTKSDNSPAQSVWSPFKADTDYFKPSTREFMINFAVDDLESFLANLESKGVKALDRQKMDGMGSFAWIVDPDGTKIEFWQPEKE